MAGPVHDRLMWWRPPVAVRPVGATGGPTFRTPLTLTLSALPSVAACQLPPLSISKASARLQSSSLVLSSPLEEVTSNPRSVPEVGGTHHDGIGGFGIEDDASRSIEGQFVSGVGDGRRYGRELGVRMAVGSPTA